MVSSPVKVMSRKYVAKAQLPAFVRVLVCLGLVAVLAGGCGESTTAESEPVVEKPQRVVAIETSSEPEQAQQAEQVQEVEQPQQAAKAAGPRITFESLVYDFGEVAPGTPNVGQFRFTNTGDATLRVLKVGTCCGVSHKLSKKIYAPGESGVLELQYRAASQPGTFRRTISFSTNDPENAQVTLTVKAQIVRRVTYEPQRLKLFLKRENAGCSEIILKSTDGKPFSITGFKATAQSMTADFDSAVKATEFVLKPKVNTETLAKNLQGRVDISTDHPECDSVHILYDVLPQFTVNPSQIILLKVMPGEMVERAVWILSNYGEDFEIESITSDKGIVKVVKREKVGNRYELKVEITPPAEKTATLLTDKLQVKMQDGEEITIGLRGFY